MRRGVMFFTGLIAGILSGCATEAPLTQSSWKEGFHNLSYLNTGNAVHLEVRLIEQRLGDTYINQEVWDSLYVDEQVVEFKQREGLKNNGYRVGQIVGVPPTRLHELMTLERCCINPRRLLIPSGKPNTISLSSVRPQCSYQIDHSGSIQEVELKGARCGLMVVPALTDDGNIILRFTPKVEYGDEASTFRPVKDQSGKVNWVLEYERPSKVHSPLSWEVTVKPNTYLIVGGRLDQPDSLGFISFTEARSRPPLQRLLVLRAGRSFNAGIDAEIAHSPVVGDGESTSLPLALQALQPTARAYRK